LCFSDSILQVLQREREIKEEGRIFSLQLTFRSRWCAPPPLKISPRQTASGIKLWTEKSNQSFPSDRIGLIIFSSRSFFLQMPTFTLPSSVLSIVRGRAEYRVSPHFGTDFDSHCACPWTPILKGDESQELKSERSYYFDFSDAKTSGMISKDIGRRN